jgi:NitT/TauT family transport system substrate-binding protein
MFVFSETPARKVVRGLADLCVAPSESVISCWTSEPEKLRPIAVAALLQRDTSAIVTLKSSGIDSLAKLDETRKYASYGGRFEMAIVQQMIKNAGGTGNVVEVLPPKLDCFDCVLRSEADATWIFAGWEGLIAKNKGIELNYFPVTGSNVPYGYSPIILARPDLVVGEDADIDLLTRFMIGCDQGYIFATSYPNQAAEILYQQANHESLHKLGLDFVIESQNFMSRGYYYLNSRHQWGTMNPQRWMEFTEWLYDNNCITLRDGSIASRDSFNPFEIFTNNPFFERSIEGK